MFLRLRESTRQHDRTLVAPPAIPTIIPPVDLQQHFDPQDYSGTGIEGGLATGAAPRSDGIYAAAGAEEAPALLSAPPPYPDLLRRVGIQGRVLVQAVVDTTGRVEPASVRIIASSSPALELPTKRWALQARFRPARLQGRAVRVLVNLPITYSTLAAGG